MEKLTPKWQPELDDFEIEQEMEKRDLPEEDRDEIRRCKQFFRWRSEKKDGKQVAPLTPEMKAWLLGEDLES